MFELVIFITLDCSGENVKYFPNFHWKHVVTGNQATKCYHRLLEIRINLLMKVAIKYCDDCNISVKASTHCCVI